VLGNTFHTDIVIICLTKEFIRLVVDATELMVFSDLFFLTGQLENDKIFGKHVWFDLWVMLVSAGRTV
jgi:hypothetical protein